MSQIDAIDAEHLLQLAWTCESGQVMQIVRAADCVNVQNEAGESLLMVAAASGDLEFAKTLVNLGADVNLNDADGSTALHFAADNNRLSLALFLIQNGAELHAFDVDEATPLDVAGNMGFGQMQDLLRDPEGYRMSQEAAGAVSQVKTRVRP